MANILRRLVILVSLIGLAYFVYSYAATAKALKEGADKAKTTSGDENEILVDENMNKREEIGSDIPKSFFQHDNEIAVFETSLGQMTFGFFPKAAPKTVKHFKAAIKDGYFDGCSFYRMEPNFVLQGGCHHQIGPNKASLPTIPLEYKLPNKRGMVSTARTSDPNSATSEFAIQLNDANAKWLGNGPGSSDNLGYAVFMEVLTGWETIDKAMAHKTKGPVKIIKASLLANHDS